jgi:hypothetical protein
MRSNSAAGSAVTGAPMQVDVTNSTPVALLLVTATSAGLTAFEGALDLFYTWNETRMDEQPMRAVWRPFVWITNPAQEDIWGTNMYLGNIEIAKGKTVLDVIKGWQAATKEETAVKEETA